MALTPQWLDELRSRVTLSALIGRAVKVTKAGREFKACCPFHNEKTPSFTINDEKGFYHCFGCSAHGDAIRWMTDQRGLSFMDAIRELADAKYGLGWRTFNYAGHGLAGHSGAVDGYRTTMIFEPATRTGVAVMWNSNWGRPFRIPFAVFDAADKKAGSNWLDLSDAPPAR